MDLRSPSEETYYTLLAVRPDGVAPIVDLLAEADLHALPARVAALLAEHASCSQVEVWRDGTLLRTISRD